MYSGFTEGFTGHWAEAVRSGTAGDLCPADIFGPDAAGGAEALQVTPLLGKSSGKKRFSCV